MSKVRGRHWKRVQALRRVKIKILSKRKPHVLTTNTRTVGTCILQIDIAIKRKIRPIVPSTNVPLLSTGTRISEQALQITFLYIVPFQEFRKRSRIPHWLVAWSRDSRSPKPSQTRQRSPGAKYNGRPRGGFVRRSGRRQPEATDVQQTPLLFVLLSTSFCVYKMQMYEH